MKKVWLMLTMMVCILASCSDDDSVKYPEIIINPDIIWNGLSFDAMEEEQSISFSVNTDWALSIASASGSVDWCKASATSGNEGLITVKFSVTENKDYEERSVFVTIRADVLEETFMITQKASDALLVTTDKYEVPQEGGQIEIEVKANIDYQIEISEDAKSWITETYSRALTTRKNVFDVTMNTSTEEREGEIIFRNGDKVEKVKVSQEGITVVSVTLKEAGTLKSLLGDNYLDIKSLKIVGPINGDDVYCLRKMLGALEFSEAKRGKLISLDLSEASIVEGGEWYCYDTFFGHYCYTFNDAIGDCMFEYCVNLKIIILPNNLSYIGRSAFASCVSLSSIIIVDSVKSIDIWAFSGCESLTSIVMGSGVENIGQGVFVATSLDSVHIKDLSAWCNISYQNEICSNPLVEGKKLYLNDKELTELIIPKEITKINDFAFQGCESIVKIIIHNGVTEIGQSAFSAAPITECYIYATTPPNVKSDAFHSVKSGAILYVPAGCIKEYESKWGRYFDNIVEMD